MKKLITLLFVALFFSSCGVSIRSVVDESAVKEPYSNPLIVIPYEKYSTRNFSKRLKEKIEAEFGLDEKNVEIFLYENKQKELALNASEGIEEKIRTSIVQDKKDLLLIFTPTDLQYYNGSLQSATYELTGIDTYTQREVWKATFTSSSSFGPALFAEKSAKTIYTKLKTDKVL